MEYRKTTTATWTATPTLMAQSDRDFVEEQRIEKVIERLANRSAERAVTLANEKSTQSQELAVQRAVRDSRIDRDLQDHTDHLRLINGSQAQTVESLAGLKEGLDDLSARFDLQAAVTDAIGKHIAKQSGLNLSRRSIIIGITGLVLMWLTLMATVILAFV